MIKFRGREISQQNLALLRRFPADVLRYVANGKIYRIGRLSTELSELCFVGRYYDWNNGAIFASCCGLNLFLARKGEPEDSNQSPTKKKPYLRIPPPLSCIHLMIDPNSHVFVSI